MDGSSHVVPCQRCGGYKVSERVSWLARGRSKLALLLAILTVTTVAAFRLHCRYGRPDTPVSRQRGHQYDRWLPLVLVGGAPRSGASLVRVLLDAHPSVRCGPDTRVIPRVLQMYHHWLTNAKEHARLIEAGVDSQVLEAAVAGLLLEVIVRHGESALRLCNKDPLTIQFAHLLSQLFPNAKFLLVVRDGRAAVHSIISRQIPVARYDLDSYQDSLEQWNNASLTMLDQCLLLGATRCRVLRYEQLVLSPRATLVKLLDFLDLPWADAVLHHETLVGKPGGIRLSRYERSSAEVRRAIHQDSLYRWVEGFPRDVARDVPRLAPLLARLGYDPLQPYNATPPDYSTFGAAGPWDHLLLDPTHTPF